MPRTRLKLCCTAASCCKSWPREKSSRYSVLRTSNAKQTAAILGTQRTFACRVGKLYGMDGTQYWVALLQLALLRLHTYNEGHLYAALQFAAPPIQVSATSIDNVAHSLFHYSFMQSICPALPARPKQAPSTVITQNCRLPTCGVCVLHPPAFQKRCCAQRMRGN